MPEGRSRVLVADDDHAIRTLIATVLTRRGCAVDVVQDGVTAMQRIAAVTTT
jgi:CheY-like chemotaxis protein